MTVSKQKHSSQNGEAGTVYKGDYCSDKQGQCEERQGSPRADSCKWCQTQLKFQVLY